MAERLTKEAIEIRKKLAYTLYTKDGVITQKELAERVGISEKTIGKWITEGHWEKERTSILLTKEETLKRIYEQFTELNDTIAKRPKGSRYAIPKEADTIIKLSAAIKNMETDLALQEVIETLKRLINFVRVENLNEAKIIMRWADIFIKTLLK